MEPIAIAARKSGEWVIIHRCTECGALRENRIAGDDNEMALLSLAVRPVALPPFPLDNLVNNIVPLSPLSPTWERARERGHK